MTAERNRDLPDLIVSLQRSSEPTVPVGQADVARFLGLSETPVLTDLVTITGTGTTYYCSPAGVGHDPIIAGFFTAS
jgi:hypothetical protein